jgi:hypothetical protein
MLPVCFARLGGKPGALANHFLSHSYRTIMHQNGVQAIGGIVAPHVDARG